MIKRFALLVLSCFVFASCGQDKRAKALVDHYKECEGKTLVSVSVFVFLPYMTINCEETKEQRDIHIKKDDEINKEAK